MIASLPMYDLPEVQHATDALWQAIAERLDVAVALVRQPQHMDVWRDPNLLFSQTCGYPFTHEFAGTLTYVATPHYAADGCDGANYRSIVLAREAKPLVAFRNARAAFNSPDSMSGCLALQLAFAPFATDGAFFSGAYETGSHAASLASVQSGETDICAIDCVTLALLRRYRPAACAGLVEVGRTPAVPGLPFVTRAFRVSVLQAALASVFADPALKQVREALLLLGCSVLPADAYAVIPALESSLN